MGLLADQPPSERVPCSAPAPGFRGPQVAQQRAGCEATRPLHRHSHPCSSTAWVGGAGTGRPHQLGKAHGGAGGVGVQRRQPGRACVQRRARRQGTKRVLAAPCSSIRDTFVDADTCCCSRRFCFVAGAAWHAIDSHVRHVASNLLVTGLKRMLDNRRFAVTSPDTALVAAPGARCCSCPA